MKIVYNGPQGIVELRGVGVIKRYEPFDTDDETGRELLKNPMFKEAKQTRDKPKEEV